ncbi:MAG: NAD kinase [Bacteroidota bacterium]
MQVVVFSRVYKEKDREHIQHLFDVLHEEQVTVYVQAAYLDQIQDKIDFKNPVGRFEGYIDFQLRRIDFVITLGGDGTILSAVTEVRDSKVPILGINLGRLGFLASIERGFIREAIRLLKRGMYSYDDRSLLYLESNRQLFGDLRFALNDITLLKRDTSSMIVVRVYINGDYLSSYWADGIIVATPTGSTGYSLSCGGPIIFPNSGNFIITPVAPHNLNVRPIVISDNSVISFTVEGRSDNFLCTLDSRFEPITAEDQLAVRKADFKVRLIQLRDRSFLRTIRDKLTWGIDQRN